jgi:hypothetical protein
MPPRQNFASILKSLKSDNSKTMLHPINENLSEDYTQDAKSYVGDSLAKRNTVKFAYELNPLPPPAPVPLNEVLRTKIKKVDEKHFTNIYKKTKKIVLPIEPKPASIPHIDSITMATATNKDIVGLKSIYFPFQNKPLADIQRRSSSKLIKLNKKVIVLPHTSMFESSSRTSSAKSYLSTKTSRNTINHFFPKLTSKIQSDSLVDINKTNGFLADVNVLSNSSIKVSSQPLSFLGQTSSTQQYEYLAGSQQQSDFSSKVKLYGTIRMCDPTPIPLISDLIDASETSSKDNGSGLISTNMINSRRLPFLDNIYVKPNFAHYEKKFFDRHPDVLQNANLLNKQRFKLSISNIDRCMI